MKTYITKLVASVALLVMGTAVFAQLPPQNQPPTLIQQNSNGTTPPPPPSSSNAAPIPGIAYAAAAALAYGLKKRNGLK
jgi:hypothetical protein